MFVSDATVQVAALIVLGCIVASEPAIPETKEALQKRPSSTKQPATPSQNNKTNDNTDIDEDDYYDLSSDDCETIDVVPPSDIPWLLERAISNLNIASTPAPVKLESLQLLSAMSRNYFVAIMADHVTSIARALETALTDKYVEVRLHAGRAVDFLGLAMDRHEEAVTRSVQFWLVLLNGPLVALLQDEQHAVLRAVGCDCLGSVGAKAFERLPVGIVTTIVVHNYFYLFFVLLCSKEILILFISVHLLVKQKNFASIVLGRNMDFPN